MCSKELNKEKNKGKSKEKGYTFKALSRANAIAMESNRKAYITYIVLSLLMAANTFVSLASTEYTINSAYDLFSGSSDFDKVVIGISLFALATLGFSYLNIGRQMAENRLFLDVTYYFEKNLNNKLADIKWDYYESHDTHLKIHEVRSRSLEIIKKMINNIAMYLQAIPLFVIFSYYLSQINILAVVVYIVLVILLNGASGRIFGSIRNLWEELQPYTQKQNYFFNMTGDKISHQEYKFNRLYDYASTKWEELYDKEYKTRLKIFGRYEITTQMARVVMNIPYISMLIFIAYEIAMGKHGIGFLLMCNQLFNNVIDTLFGVYYRIIDDRTNCKFIQFYDEINSLANAPLMVNDMIVNGVDMENITYIYPQSEYKALNGLSLSIKKGEKIAVVGINGSGKTTFSNILMSLTDAFSGSIRSSKKDICPGGLVSCITQDFTRYQMTIRENIEAGDPSKCFSDSEIIEILEKVGLKDVVVGFEKGIDTSLGQLEKGIELSKGQWQRLSIARLLAKSDASIWILDEPTAYLDPLAEIDIYNMIYNLAGNRTVLFISHRLGFAKRADRIVVFESGAIVEEGSHIELIAKNGAYKMMYRNQESWYA